MITGAASHAGIGMFLVNDMYDGGAGGACIFRSTECSQVGSCLWAVCMVCELWLDCGVMRFAVIDCC